MFGRNLFTNNVVVITGGSSGLGLGLAQELAKQKAKLVLIARNDSKLEDAKEQILAETPSASVHTTSVDITDEEAVNAAVEDIVRELGGIDCLINSAGILSESYFEHFTTKDFREVMEVNFFGILNATYAALPHLKKSKGRLVNIASVAGLNGVFGLSPYCASKHALVGLTDTLRLELKPQGIRVHLICPPEFDSPMVDGINNTGRTRENEVYSHLIPQYSCDAVVKETLKGIKKNKFKIVTGKVALAATEFARLYPTSSRRISDMVLSRVYQGPKSGAPSGDSGTES